MKTKTNNAKTIAFIGMLGALSAVLMSINVPLPFAPTFLKFDIAELHESALSFNNFLYHFPDAISGIFFIVP